MNNVRTCNCTLECIGRQPCEIGSWVAPEREPSLAQARDAIRSLGSWLPSAPRTMHEITAAIFRSICFEEAAKQVDLFWALPDALRELGFEPGKDHGIETLWSMKGSDLHDESSRLSVPWQKPTYTPVCLGGTGTATKPKQFDRVIEFMAAFNLPFLISALHRTSEIARMWFPAASQEVLNSWLIPAMGESLYRIGYTPIRGSGGDNAEVVDDPEWFCDGDPKDALRHNLWNGAELGA